MKWSIMWLWIILLICGYLLGAVPFGLLICKAKNAGDPRTKGSKNIGATNVYRLAGRNSGILTLVLDAAKGFIPTALALKLLPESQAFFVGLAAFCGHVWPCYLRFKGGKGVATFLGVFLGYSPLILGGILTLIAAIVWKTGYMSLGSMVGCLAAPILLFVTDNSIHVILASAVMALLVIWRHRENILRLKMGEEPSLSLSNFK